MTIDLEIGGCRIQLREAQGRRLEHWPNEQFAEFESALGAAGVVLDVSVARELPDLKPGKLIFDAGSGLWKLFEGPSGFVVESVDPGTMRPFNRARISADFSRAEVFTLEVAADGAWDPSRVLNPLGEICLLSRLAREDGLMFHAAGVEWKGGGYMFTGPSGAGKSTISGLFTARGALLLNDERIILRGAGGSAVVHGTPWCGSNPVMHHASAPLKGLFFIKHGHRKNRLAPLPFAVAVSLCVKQSFLPYWDRVGMEQTMNNAQALIASVGGVEYAFLRRPSAVDFVLAAPERHAESPLARVS